MNHLNKETLIAEVAAMAELPKATVKKMIEAQAFIIEQAILEGCKITVPGIGQATPFWRKPRPMNPQLTGKTGMTRASLGLKWRLTPDLRAANSDQPTNEEES